MAPDIETSTKEQRIEYINRTFWCRSDCDSCGICQIFHGKEPLTVYEDYIEGRRTFREISEEYRGNR